MKKKKVYISMPIQGRILMKWKRDAHLHPERWRIFGFEPVFPLDVSNNPEASYEEHIGNDITALLQCDAVLFLKGWKESRGCNLEHEAAMIYGKAIFYSLEAIEKYSVEQCIKEQ